MTMVRPSRSHPSALARVSPWVDSVFLALLVVIGWQVISNEELIAAPATTVVTLVDGFNRGWIVPHLRATLTAVGLSLLAGGVGGLAMGVFLGANRGWYRVLSPMIVWAYAVPKIVVYPMLLLVLGVNLQSLVALGSIAAFFPLAILTATAVRTINPTYLKVARSMQARPWDIFWKVYVPAMQVPLLIGLRMAWSLSFLTVILGEMVVAQAGLGLAMFESYATMNIARMTAVLLFVFLVALLGNLLPWVFERRLHTRQLG